MTYFGHDHSESELSAMFFLLWEFCQKIAFGENVFKCKEKVSCERKRRRFFEHTWAKPVEYYLDPFKKSIYFNQWNLSKIDIWMKGFRLKILLVLKKLISFHSFSSDSANLMNSNIKNFSWFYLFFLNYFLWVNFLEFFMSSPKF